MNIQRGLILIVFIAQALTLKGQHAVIVRKVTGDSIAVVLKGIYEDKGRFQFKSRAKTYLMTDTGNFDCQDIQALLLNQDSFQSSGIASDLLGKVNLVFIASKKETENRDPFKVEEAIQNNDDIGSANMDIEFAYILGGIGAFGEMVNAGVKKMALSAPLPAGEMDRIMAEAIKVAERNHVLLFRESDLLVTDLFPADETAGKDVLLIYQGTAREEYLQLKADARKLEEAGLNHGKARADIARRMGRLLSYPPQQINELIAQNSPFRTLKDFGVRASNLFLYYKDLQKASDFYSKTLGMEMVADYTMAKIFRMTSDSYLILVDAKKGMHTAEEPKTVALALITDQLQEWHTYLKATQLKIKYDYSPKPNRPHDGFVIYDTEGYLLEFERFNAHPENENLLPHLDLQKTISSSTTLPKGLGFKATITWLYYKDMVGMENFYQEVMGLPRVADQGWAKIYKGSESGYIGLVDERRGMHSFTEKKAVNVSFIIDDLDGWFTYVRDNKSFELRGNEVSIGPESKYRSFVGYDPEGYYLEFDTFYDHAYNMLLMKYLYPDK
jgi:catechol 2,3-dioxygenase-like lactoylglutathione lyase family enzyme